MATVYKVEIEIVSDWVNYTPEDIEKLVKEMVNRPITINGVKTALNVTEVKVERKA